MISKGILRKCFINIIIVLFIIKAGDVFGATYATKPTANGPWSTSSNWSTSYPGCCTLTGPGAGHTYNIFGKITVGSLTVNETLTVDKGLLNIEDTLIIYGDLVIGNNGNLSLTNGSVLIVYGNVSIDNQVTIAANSYFVIMGNFTKTGSAAQGSFTSDDHPSNVYIGGSVNVPDGWEDDGPNDVFNCTVSQHDSSDCNYGNGVDLENNPDINDIVFENGCASGTTGGVIADNQNVCSGADPVAFTNTSSASPGTPNYQWYFSTTSSDPDAGTWIVISGATSSTYDPTSLTATTNYFRKATLSSYCKANSNVLTITVNAAPAASIISGNTTTCAGSTGEIFSVTYNAAWTYSWIIEDNVGNIQGANNTNSITVNWKTNSEIFTGPYSSDTQMIRTVTSTVNFNPANGCPAILEWDVTINRLPVTGPQYHIHNQWNE